MKRLLSILFVLFHVCLFSACADKGNVNIDVGDGKVETVSEDIGRYTAWTKVETAKAVALGKIGAAKKVPENSTGESITVVLDTPEKIQQWSFAQLIGKVGDALVQLSENQKPDPIAENLKPAPMPKGAFAEGADSVLKGVADLADSPTAVAVAVGKAIGKAIHEAGGGDGGTRVQATEGAAVNINQSDIKGYSNVGLTNPKAGSTDSVAITEMIPAEK